MTTVRFLPVFAGALSLLALAGCSKSVEPKAATAAGGEVLPGTISDAMLDPERSQAQAPLQPVKVSRPKVDDLVSDGASEAAAPAEAVPAAPAAKPDAG